MKKRLGIWMSYLYLYYNSNKDTPVCGHLYFDCLNLKYEEKVGYLDEFLICLFDLILLRPLNNLSVMWDGSSWV